MYRDNEASRVSDALAAKLAGDVPALVTAATRLWLLPVDPGAATDAAATEVWQAIEALGPAAVTAAVAAAVALIRERQRLRPSAFLDVIEHIEDPTLLLELATAVLDAGWPSYPYLATICLWLIELKQENPLWAYLQPQRDLLRADPAGWALMALILTTSRIGDNDDVTRWFRGWEEREAVPMWAIAAQVATLLQHGNLDYTLLALQARLILDKAIPDATASLFVGIQVCEELRQGRDDAFRRQLEAHRAQIFEDHALLDHPIVRYINGVKRRNPIRQDDFSFSLADLNSSGGTASLAMLAAKGAPVRPVSWRATELIKLLEGMRRSTMHIVPIVVEMMDTPAGDPKARELYVTMRKARRSWGTSGLAGAFARLTAQRISKWQKFKLDFL